MDVRVQQVPHVSLVWLDVELLARVLLESGTDLAEELDLLLDGGHLSVGVPSFLKILRDSRERSDEDGNSLVERHSQGLGLVQRIWVGGVAAEVMEVLLNLARQGHRLA